MGEGAYPVWREGDISHLEGRRKGSHPVWREGERGHTPSGGKGKGGMSHLEGREAYPICKERERCISHLKGRDGGISHLDGRGRQGGGIPHREGKKVNVLTPTFAFRFMPSSKFTRSKMRSLYASFTENRNSRLLFNWLSPSRDFPRDFSIESFPFN
jgi:hypothetical protein